MNSPDQDSVLRASDEIVLASDEQLLLRLRLAKICGLERSLKENAATLAALRAMLSLGKPPCDE